MIHDGVISRLFRTLAGVTLGFTVVFAAPESHAQTPIKFSLDWKFEGPLAPFLLRSTKVISKPKDLMSPSTPDLARWSH